MREPADWHCLLTQRARAMKLSPPQASAGSRAPIAAAPFADDVDGAADTGFAAAGGLFAGVGRGAGERAASARAASERAASADACLASEARGAVACVASIAVTAVAA
jgi:hypothetical protein